MSHISGRLTDLEDNGDTFSVGLIKDSMCEKYIALKPANQKASISQE